MDGLVDMYSIYIGEEDLLEMNDSSSDVIRIAAHASTITDDFAGNTTTVGSLELGGIGLRLNSRLEKLFVLHLMRL